MDLYCLIETTTKQRLSSSKVDNMTIFIRNHPSQEFSQAKDVNDSRGIEDGSDERDLLLFVNEMAVTIIGERLRNLQT
jgi:hypothetical protein